MRGVAIPLAYQSLQKPGISNTEERQRLLTAALAYLEPSACCLVAAREFIGRDGLAFVLEQSVDFGVRRSRTPHIALKPPSGEIPKVPSLQVKVVS